MPSRKDFLDAIKAAPWDDEAPRLIYADWLDEHDEPADADRQRKWVESAKWLADFLRRYKPYTYTPYDYETASHGAREVTREDIERLIDQAHGNYFASHGTDDRPGDHGEEENDFWYHIEVASGERFSPEHRSDFIWSCSC
jgi:uncharacterized protein (TIGR02996 family)